MIPDDIEKVEQKAQKLLPPPTDTRIVSILCNFDFDRVVKVVRLFDPRLSVNVRQVKLVAVALLRNVARGPKSISEFEGLEAIRNSDGTLSLTFVLENWDA